MPTKDDIAAMVADVSKAIRCHPSYDGSPNKADVLAHAATLAALRAAEARGLKLLGRGGTRRRFRSQLEKAPDR